jgi:hypothetical protein
MASAPPAMPVAAHHLQQHHPVVALGGGMQAVDGFRGHVQRGGEADRELGAAEVVVDGLGHTDDGDPVLVGQPPRRRQGAFAADDDQARQLVDLEGLGDPLGPGGAVDRVDTAGADDRAAAVEDPSGRVARQLLRVALQHALPTIAEADGNGVVLVVPAPDDRPDDRVQPGAVTAACEHSDSRHHCGDPKRAASPS